MKYNEQKNFDLNKEYWNFMKSFRDYVGKEDIRKMFYARLYLIYLAKRYKIFNLNECKNFSELLKKIDDFWVILDITKEFDNLNIIKELFEKNGTKEELDSKLFKEMSKLTIEELEEIFRENSLELRKYLGSEDDETSKTIAELVRELLNINVDDAVLDLCCGKGCFLSSLTTIEGVNLYGIEINHDSAFIAKIRLAALTGDSAKIVVGDAITYDFGRKFDKIFCEYPLGLRVDSYILNQLNKDSIYSWNRSGLTTDWIFLNRIVTLLKQKGTAALIITDGPLFKSLDVDCRRDILLSKIVKYIIKLPSGILPYTNISPNLMILSSINENDEIKFIDATQEYTENKQKEKQLNIKEIINLINGNNNDDEKVKAVKTSDILNTEDKLLTVNSYLKRKNPNYINPKVLKGLLIDNYRGYQFLSKELSEIENINGDYEILAIGDINDGMISNNLLKVNGNNNKYDRYLLKEGDIVITAKGSKVKVAVAEVGNRKIIPNGNLLVLRLDTEKIDPYYLQGYLNSENGLLSLERIQTGAKIISINPSRIEQINVSMVDKESQEVFAEKYKHKMSELYLAKKHVQKIQEEMDNLFTQEIEEKQKNE